jgi:hypothetical protein
MPDGLAGHCEKGSHLPVSSLHGKPCELDGLISHVVAPRTVSSTRQRQRLLYQVETSNQSQGKTVLYLPSELEDIQDVRKAASNKDTVQHLESIVIHWTRQIKDVVGIFLFIRHCPMELIPCTPKLTGK